MEKFHEVMKSLYKILTAFVVVVLTAVLSYKVVTGAILFDMSKFTFTDLLSMVLALFSIAISLIFYHKATETSNTFYDNTYKFTNHVSEVLGRIESEFSERLRHIDEGYTKLGDRFDKIPLSQKREAEAVIEAEEQEIDRKVKERDNLLEDLARRAQLQESEKNEVLMRFRKQEVELADARREANRLRRRLQSELSSGLPDRLRSYIRDLVIPKLGSDFIDRAPPSAIAERFKEIRSELATGFLNEMVKSGLLNDEGGLRPAGVNVLRRAVEPGSRDR